MALCNQAEAMVLCVLVVEMLRGTSRRWLGSRIRESVSESWMHQSVFDVGVETALWSLFWMAGWVPSLPLHP